LIEKTRFVQLDSFGHDSGRTLAQPDGDERESAEKQQYDCRRFRDDV
jgi:hypothetical protein